MKAFFLMLFCLSIGLYQGQAQQVVPKGARPTKAASPSKTIFYNTDQLTGKWQEFQRGIAGSSAKVDFKDTLLLNFNKRDSVYIYDGVSMSQRGLVAIDGPATLTLAADTYTILSLTKTNMVLSDGEFTRHFKTTKQFHHEMLGNLKADAESFEQPVKLNAAHLLGRWDIYRRQAKPGVSDSILVKSISFTAVKDSLKGTIAIYSSGSTRSENFTGYLLGTTLVLNAGGRSWQWDTYKADGTEFVFGRDKEIIYYAKKF